MPACRKVDESEQLGGVLAQGIDRHFEALGLLQQVEQHDGALFTLLRLEHGLQGAKRPVGDLDDIALAIVDIGAVAAGIGADAIAQGID